ncbi:MAG: AraC family transcriptional regulator [Lachnospiraceae bacterium]|jgi:AraC-like DNA-binding protein/mannose-6-phosphate isomerase-like protein (cupin superfamily)|nr:AraC family transcriptional regulator [uncultured Acetatifactor sp.]MCI9218483.1 AraC family transcriptional regulator [Lachnospiraceae bacterium]
MFINSFGEEIITEKIYTNEILEINLAGITYPNLNYRMQQNTDPSSHFHYRYYVFEYVLEGEGYIETPEKVYHVSAGDLYFLNKGQYHIYYADCKNPFKKEFIVVRGAFPDSLASLFAVEKSVIILHQDVHPLFQQIFRNLETAGQLPNDESERQVLQLFQLVRTPVGTDILERPLPDRIMDYLYDHVKENLTLSALCTDLHVSESVAHHAFTKQFNKSIMKHHMSIRLDYAQQLLLQSSEAISSIARRLSFADEKYFSKCFKREFGYTPTQFRNSPVLSSTREFPPKE